MMSNTDDEKGGGQTNSRLFMYSWSYEKEYTNRKNIIQAYCLNERNETVVLNIGGYQPNVYVEVPRDFENKVSAFRAECFTPAKMTAVFKEMDAERDRKRPKGGDNSKYANYKPKRPERGFSPDGGPAQTEYLHALYYYTPELKMYLKCTYNSMWLYRQFIERMALPVMGRKINVHEADDFNLTPVIKLIAQQQLQPVGWIHLAKTAPESDGAFLSMYKQDYRVWKGDISMIDAESALGRSYPDFCIMSVDIECVSSESRANLSVLPNPEKSEDKVFNIGVAVYRNKSMKKYLLYTCDHEIDATEPLCDNDGGVIECRHFKDEPSLLIGFRNLVRTVNPQIITGYNVIRFDFNYMIKRAALHYCQDDFIKLGVFENKKSDLHYERTDDEEDHKITVVNSKHKQNKTVEGIDMHGRLLIDMMNVIKASVRLDQYTLSAVCNHYKIPNKDPMTVQGIFDAFRHQNVAQLRTVGAYCVQDAYVSLLLFNKLVVLYELMENARTCQVPPNVYCTRGHQVRFASQLYTFCKQHKFVMDGANYNSPIDEYVGAYNLPPKTGLWHNVLAMDFASLYPSLMISNNICFTTLIRDDADLSNLSHNDYNEYKWEDHVNCEHTDHPEYLKKPTARRKFVLCTKDTSKYPKGKNVIRFVKPHIRKGIIPQLVEVFLKRRKEVRASMAKVDELNTELLSILDKRQLSNKVAANAMYGLLGIPKKRNGYVSLMEGAATITYQGRTTIRRVISQLECEFDAQAVYGDSVTGDTALILKNENGLIYTSRIDEIDGEWTSYHNDKECFMPINGTKVWTENGFTDIIRIIRHKTSKPIKRIVTHTGVVDATTDHSLLTLHNERITPNDVHIGSTELLHAPKCEIEKQCETVYKQGEAFAMGMFLAEGSCGEYHYTKDSGHVVKYSWAINNQDLDLLNKCKNGLPFETKILDTMKSSSVYKLVPVGDIKSTTLKYRDLFYNEHGEKKIPLNILNAPINIISDFMDGFYAGDGEKFNQDIVTLYRYDQKGKEVGTGLWIIAQRLGWDISIYSRKDKPSVFRYTLNKTHFRRNTNKVKAMWDISNTGTHTVYDLETKSHHFHVGPGNLVVHNTDSCMVVLNKYKDAPPSVALVDELTNVANQITDRINMDMVKPMCLAYEGKVYHSMLIMAKKRYFNVLMSKSGDGASLCFDVNCKGLPLKRRGYCAFMKMLYKYVINACVHNHSFESITQKIDVALDMMFRRQIPTSDFVLTSNIRDKYKSANIAQAKLADRYLKRTGIPLVPDTRVGFVYTDLCMQKAKHADEAEFIDYFMLNSDILRINYLDYMASQLVNPIDQLLITRFGEAAILKSQIYNGGKKARRATTAPKPDSFMQRLYKYRLQYDLVIDELKMRERHKLNMRFFRNDAHRLLYKKVAQANVDDIEINDKVSWIQKTFLIGDSVYHRPIPKDDAKADANDDAKADAKKTKKKDTAKKSPPAFEKTPCKIFGMTESGAYMTYKVQTMGGQIKDDIIDPSNLKLVAPRTIDIHIPSQRLFIHTTDDKWLKHPAFVHEMRKRRYKYIAPSPPYATSPPEKSEQLNIK